MQFDRLRMRTIAKCILYHDKMLCTCAGNKSPLHAGVVVCRVLLLGKGSAATYALCFQTYDMLGLCSVHFLDGLQKR